MKSYFSLFRVRMINGLQYRAVALGSIFTRFCWAFMEILTFYAVHKSGKSSLPMTFTQTASYIWIQQTFILLYDIVDGDQEIEASINNGFIAYELARPMNLYGNWFTQCLANRLSPTMLNCLPALILALLMPFPYRLCFPDILTTILFLISTILALGVVAALAILMHITMFYTTSQRGIKIIMRAVTSFFAGGLIPLPYFPAAFQKVINLLPFASTRSTPLLIYSGSLTGSCAAYAIILQIFWLVTLSVFGHYAMNRILKHVIVQGG